MKKIKKTLSFFLCLAMTVSVFSQFPIKPRAASATGVYGGIAPSVMSSVIDDMEDDFNLETSEWSPSVGTCTVLTESESAPYSPYEGGGSLLWNVGAVSASDRVKLTKTTSALTESSYYQSCTATFFIPQEAGGASVTMKLVGTRGTITVTKKIDAGKWQTVFFETDAQNRGAIVRLEFTLQTDKACDLCVLADCIGGCWSPYDMRSARYLAQSFEAFGCTCEYDRNMILTLDGEGQYIEAQNAVNASFGEGVGLRVNMINHTSCRTVTLKYKTESSSEYDREITLDIPDSDREVTLLFKIPEEKITSFILLFGGAPTGDVEIISIGPSPCFEEIPSVGSITECRIARDLKNVSVKGTLDIIPSDGRVMLYALMPNEDNSNIELLREPLAEERVTNGEFSFTVPLDRDGDALYKKYVVAVNTENGLTVVCEPGYINNPELLATERTSLPESKKGIRPLPDNYVLYGFSQTALDIDLTELLSSSGGTVTHTVGSATCSFSKSVLDTLDAVMKEYSREGIKVRFVYKLTAGGGIISHPESAGGSAALNTASAEGINTLRVLTDLLVRRYGSSGGETDNLIGIVLGSSVNEAYDNYDLGAVTLSGFAREYSTALRVIYNAALSVTSGFEVSASLGGAWNGETTVGQRGSFDARSALEAISDCMTAGGDINWKLAYDITPEKGKCAYNELSPDLGVGAERITAANLEALTEFFSLPQFLYNGASRSVLLLGNEEIKAGKNEEKALTADYIYTLLRISDRSMKNITGYIPSSDADYGEALKYVGTELFASKVGFASELIGRERFDALVAAGSFTDRSYTEASGIASLPTGIKGESVIFNLKKKNVPIPSLKCVSAESGVSYGERSDWARIRLGEAESDALRGFVLASSYPLDLSVAPYISFDIIVSSLPEGVESVTVTLALYSNKNVSVASTSVKVDTESTVCFDMAAFKYLSSCDRIGIYITGENGEEIGEPMMLVSSVKAHSETLSGDKLDKAINALKAESDTVSVYTVINLIIVAAASITALAIRIVLKNKRRASASGDNE